jgi:hypothetical protein
MTKQIDELNHKLDKLLNKKQIFIRGIVRGLGVAIGTTIVAAIVLSILAVLLKPVFQQFGIKDIITRYQQTK